MAQTLQITERMHSVNGLMELQRVLIPTLDMLSEKIRQVPPAGFRDLKDIGSELAQEHGADVTCPVTVQRLMKAVAVIAHSAVTLKDPHAVPFWRVVDLEKPNWDKLAGGRGFILAQRAREQRASQG